MIWEITMLSVHLCALAGCFLLYKEAPCWMQKLVVVGIGTGMTVCAIAFALSLAGVAHARWPIFIIGLLLTHTAVLLYVFRLIYQGHLEWNSSERSPSSPR